VSELSAPRQGPPGLQPGWKRLHEAGFGTGGDRQQRCARLNCRQLAKNGSDYCRLHDVHGQRKRLQQIRSGTGKPPTPLELAKLHRADTKSLWLRAPWLPLMTIWLAPNLEAGFTEDCRRAGLLPGETAPVVLNTLRWCWRRSVLNRDDDPGWHRAVAAARKHQAKIGPPPEDYVYHPPSAAPPADPRIKPIAGRASAAEMTTYTALVDRSTKAKARRQASRDRHPASSSQFDPAAFISEHWVTMFGPLFKARKIDPAEVDGVLGQRLAHAWRAVLDARQQPGEAAAYKRWRTLLRQL